MQLTDILLLFGGIGLFLYGMNIMSQGLRNACGDKLRVILKQATRNKVTSVLVGAGTTVLIQSSSATDVMVIGFVTSGLMTLYQAIGVIMGANVGTTITAQITAFNIGAYAPAILFLGAVMHLFFKKKIIQHIGSIILGFGMLFQGISMLKTGIAPLAGSEEFKAFMTGLSNPALTVLFGILFTALLQSSSSSIVIFQAFAIQGLLSYDTVVYLIIGAAIGSVMPNLLAGLTANRNGKRCAILNLLFNVLRASVILVIISAFPQATALIQSLSPGDIGRQIANTHTIFAFTSVVLLLPFSNYIVKMSELLLPKTEVESKPMVEHKLVFLTQTDKVPVAIAISQAHNEISRMGHLALANMVTATECFFRLDDHKMEEVYETEGAVDFLSRAIVDKLVELRTEDMTSREKNRLYNMIQVVDDLERISDHAENIVEYQARIHKGEADISVAGLNDLYELSKLTLRSLTLCLDIFENERFEALPEAEQLENDVDDLQEEIIKRHVERLMRDNCNPLGGVIFTDMSSDLERCSDHAINIANALSGKKAS